MTTTEWVKIGIGGFAAMCILFLREINALTRQVTRIAECMEENLKKR